MAVGEKDTPNRNLEKPLSGLVNGNGFLPLLDGATARFLVITPELNYLSKIASDHTISP